MNMTRLEGDPKEMVTMDIGYRKVGPQRNDLEQTVAYSPFPSSSAKHLRVILICKRNLSGHSANCHNVSNEVIHRCFHRL